MRLRVFLYLAGLIIILSGCELSNMASKYNTVKYTVTPPILQVHGGNVALNIDANFPEKYFAKKATVKLTPVLVYEDGETPFKTITIQGEEASGGDNTIFYTNGGSLSYTDEISFSDKMTASTLELRATAKLKSPLNLAKDSKEQEQVLGPITIANGILATSRRVLNNEELANQNHKYEHETILEETATIYFLVNQSNIRTTEKSKEDVRKLKEFAKNRYKTHSIEIMSYASPEGSVNTNTSISKSRMDVTVKYTKKLLKSFNVDGANDDNLYTETSIGEDWEGFKSVVGSSQIKDKRKINKIVSSVEDVELREQQIRDLSEVYDALKDDVLPQLRKATIIIRSFEPKRTDDEIAKLSTTYPDSLTLEELLFSATLTDNDLDQAAIYFNVEGLHNDWRGYNNLACMHLGYLRGDGNLTHFLSTNNSEQKIWNYLKKAKELGGEQSDILINEGILAAWKGDLQTAQKLFDRGNASEKNQAILDIRKGDYSKAARYFKNDKSHNGVLAQIMNGKNNVNCSENTAACYYLNAISAARRGENQTAIKNLSKAISSNPEYKKEAAIDLEFINLRLNDSFIAIIK